MAFRHIKPSWKHYLEYVKLAAQDGDTDMLKVMGSYGGLTRHEQNTIMPEQLCGLSGVPVEALFGAVCTQLWRSSRMEANIITAAAYPRVIERTAKNAAAKGGIRDREMFHKHTGFLPSPSGPAVTINNNPQTAIVNGTQIAPGLPSMEEEALNLESINVPLIAAPELA